VVDDHDVVADRAVVGDVARRHDQTGAADLGVLALPSGAVNRGVLADRRLVADTDPDGYGVAVLEILRAPADERAGADEAAGADLDPSLQDGVRSDLRFLADPHLWADDGVRPHADGRSQLGPRIDHGGRMYHAALLLGRAGRLLGLVVVGANDVVGEVRIC